ncbi:MAG: rod shape-determining protein RodA [Candidatus Hydrogenedentes bacterium]|nr:rod shape-determining protein RodA [Candidatus Hydrogenedentota bacterium]
MTHLAKNANFADAHIGVFDLGNVRRIDWLLTLLTLLLVGAGLLTLYAATRSADSATPYYQKQIVFFLAGSCAAILIVCIDHRFLVTLAPIMYVAAILMLLGVLLHGTQAKGGQRWLVLGPFRVQPSEQCKIIMVYSLAWYFTTVQQRIRQLPYFLLTFVITAIPAILILKQPNLSTAASMAPITIGMLYVAGCKKWHLIALVLIGLAAIPFAYFHLKDYQRTRVDTFLGISAETDDKDAQSKQDDIAMSSGWQTLQASISIGSGGLTGKGFGKVTPTELSFLPEYHNDLIFSVLAEEHGFIGSIILIGGFAAFLMRGLFHAADNPDMSGALVATGAVAILAFHVFVNIAMTIGLMPVTGIPLPFLSYGGSFYLTTMLCVGILLNASIRKGFFG